MRTADLHPAEARRLDTLQRLGILDTPAEERFDRITRLASAILETPIALVSLIDEHRQWFKSRVGLDATETPRDVAFCAHAIADPARSTLVVPDARLDDRFHDNPLVVEDPSIRFYAGRVINSPDGLPLGTLCAIDRRPRELTPTQLLALDDLGRMVEDELTRESDQALLRRLDESERQKSSILDALVEGLILQGTEGEMLEWNPAALRLLGVTTDQLSGRTSMDPEWRAVHEDGSDFPGETHPAMVALQSRERAEAVMGFPRPDGSLVWLRVRSRPTQGPDGEHRVLSVFTDITDERALAQALQASEEAARTSLDALEQGVALVEPAGRIRRLNPAAEAVLGFTGAELEEVWGRGEWQAYDEDWEPLAFEALPMIRALGGEAVDGEVVGWERKDGQRVLLRTSCVPDADGHGALLMAFTDVTREQQMLRDLSRFRHLFQHANDIITVIDAAGQVLYSSPSRQRVLGYPEDWEHDTSILGLVHPDDAEAAFAEMAHLVAGDRGPEPFTVRVRAHSGEWRHVECVGANLLDEPSVRGIVITSRDATEHVRLSEQLAHLAGHDALTDLANRSALEPALGQALARATRADAHVGVCFIDLDGFKQVNDRHGHAAGDAVLVEVAERLRTTVRAGETAIRFGGDEFLVILEAVTSVDEARIAAERIRDALSQPPITRGDDTVGASIGVAISEPGEAADTLVMRADTALYAAKAHPGSTVQLAGELVIS